MQIVLRTSRRLVRHLSRTIPRTFEAVLIFPRNLPPKSYNDILFFLHPTRKPTNLKVRYFIQVTEGLIFPNLEIDILCVVKEGSRMF